MPQPNQSRDLQQQVLGETGPLTGRIRSQPQTGQESDDSRSITMRFSDEGAEPILHIALLVSRGKHDNVLFVVSHSWGLYPVSPAVELTESGPNEGWPRCRGFPPGRKQRSDPPGVC